ncbi:MAG TPA: DUF2381 family protein [Archangium sp.]|jgi:uncharacterized protein (TIGR02268 family)|uniref:DUF2381 family protein n=1 Tax=Archangium sp. TaxID=1872627 RepID=UPI002ED91C7D
MMTFPIGWMRKAALVALVVVSTHAGAQQQPCLMELPRPRRFYLPKDARAVVPEVFVAGGVVTTLRFDSPCDPSRTKLLGAWEGRFEPLLAGGRSVVIVPLRDLAPEDRFQLLVTLADGTEVPFTLTASKTFVDRQVNVFPNPESPEALRSALEDAHQENKALREENHRRESEETSTNHSLAGLLASGERSMTPFKQTQKWALDDEGLKGDIMLLEGSERSAVLFQLTNLDPKKPWKLQEARLSALTTGEPRPFALRMSPTELPPGKAGRIAIVTNQSFFDTPTGQDKLVLEIFRDGGLQQAYIVLERKLKK